jgi:Domain of Unknown Function with PDB structure (DUF3862)
MRMGLIVVLASVLTMSGCKREIANRNIDQLKTNMSQKEVESILGNPDRIEKTELELETQRKTMAVIRYYYDQSGQTVVLNFQNGRLANPPDKLKQN